MTGLSRKAVRRLRERLPRYDEDPRISLSPLGDILHCWHTTPEFLDVGGQPIALPLQGEDRSFEVLVNRVASGVPIGAMKVELLRCGAVEECPDGLLKPIRRHTVPESSSGKLISSISFNLQGLASNIAHNSNPDRKSSGWIERFVYSPSLDSAGREFVRTKLRDQIAAFTEKVDDEFENVSASRVPSPLTIQDFRRVGVGVYYYEDPEDTSK